MSKFLFFIFFLIIYLEISNCQEVDKDMMRAVACITLIKKLENKPSDQRMLSGYILSCFINIDESTMQKLISNQASNKLDLTQDQISKLTDMYQIEQKYTEDQIMDYSRDLNAALAKLQSAGPNGMKNPSQGGESSSKSNKKQKPGLLERMFAGFIGLFNTNDSLLFLIGFFIVFYLFLRQIRKWSGNSDNNKNNNGKKVVKNKKKVK